MPPDIIAHDVIIFDFIKYFIKKLKNGFGFNKTAFYVMAFDVIKYISYKMPSCGMLYHQILFNTITFYCI